MAAKEKSASFVVKLPQFGKDAEARFGKTDQIAKLALANDDTTETGWKLLSRLEEVPTAVLYVGRDGQTFTQDFTRYPENVKGILLFHGTKQKTGDEYANLDVDDSWEAIREMDERLAEGKFYAERQGFAGISVLMRAIMKVFQLSEDQAREFLKPLTAKEKQALRASEELKPTIEELEKERGKGVDTKKLLEKLPKAA